MKNKIFNMMKSLILIFVFIALNNCSKQSNEDPNPSPEPPIATNEVDFWLTKADQSVKLQKQSGILAFRDSYNNYPNIEVDDSQTFQTVDGFGFSLTGGSAQVINSLNSIQVPFYSNFASNQQLHFLNAILNRPQNHHC